MKKVIITAIAASTIGLASSCTKNNGIQPASVSSQSVASDKSDVGSGDSAGGDGSTTTTVAAADAATISGTTTTTTPTVTKSKKGH